MNESADEPPLTSRLYSWARNNINPFHSHNHHPDPDSRDLDSLPQHVRHDVSPSTAVISREETLPPKETEQQGPAPVDQKGDGEKSSTIEGSQTKLPLRVRFYRDVKRIIFCSWINVLLAFVPPGVILGAMVKANKNHPIISPSAVFAINAVAIIPLASMLSFATESVASKMGDTIGALLNVTFGNAVELIIFIIALVANQIRIVQASLLGSILSNLLLIMGMCFVFGGLRFREQLYNSTVSQMSACLLSLSVISLLLPTAFHASFNNMATADHVVIKVSRGTSVVLLLVYIIYLLFQLKSHAYMYESTPQHLIDEESHPGILADMLNSSSSSDTSDDTDDSDSDSSSGSQTTTKRIKKVLRRTRRKSHSSSKDSTSTPSVKRSPSSTTNNTRFAQEFPQSESPRQISPQSSRNLEPVFSGDEADVDLKKRDRKPGVTYRDFEEERSPSNASKEKKKGKRKRSKRNKDPQENHDDAGTTLSKSPTAPAPAVESPARNVTVNFSPEVQEISDSASPKRPFNIRNISSVRPTLTKGLSSTVFTHHEATGRSFPYPVRHMSPVPPQASPSRTVPLQPSANRLRRTTSLPENLHSEMSIPRSVPTSAQPLPHLMPANQTPAEAKDAVEEKVHLSRTSAIVLLLVSTGLVAVCAEFLVDSIDYLVESSGISQVFIGLIVLPIVGNAAEHVTAVTVASKNKMDLAINVALGSSIQIALFVTPLIVILGWIISRDMSLYFSLFETVSLFASAFIVNYLMIDGRSNYLEGALLIAAYVIIAVAAYFYPPCGSLSAASGPASGSGAC